MAGEDYVRRCRCNAISGHGLDPFDWQRYEIRDVGQQVESDNQKCSECERERNVATRVLHFSGGEGDVVPGVGSEKRVRLRHADAHEQSERGRGGQAFADIL